MQQSCFHQEIQTCHDGFSDELKEKQAESEATTADSKGITGHSRASASFFPAGHNLSAGKHHPATHSLNVCVRRQLQLIFQVIFQDLLQKYSFALFPTARFLAGCNEKDRGATVSPFGCLRAPRC